MVQFHPTGLLAGPDTRMTGTVLEEGLRGAGGYLLGGDGERFMHKYDARGERATRDIVSRAMIEEINGGNTSRLGGLYLQMSHLGAEKVRSLFKGMVQRCADCGFDLAGGRVEVIPTAHYMMGGVIFNVDGTTALPGLFAAGEDTGGVHGANRLGGNGVANSTVFGRIAGDTMAKRVSITRAFSVPDEESITEAIRRYRRPLNRPPAGIEAIRERLHETMWNKVGILRDAHGLEQAQSELVELERELEASGVVGTTLAYNMGWHDWIDLKNLILVSRAIAAAALARQDSRGAHYRTDFPASSDLASSRFTRARFIDGDITIDTERVRFTRVRPGETLLN